MLFRCRVRPLSPRAAEKVDSRAVGALLAAPVLEEVHLLLDDVGPLAHAAQEDARVLEGGGIDALIAEGAADALRRLPHQPPVGLLGGENVGSVARRPGEGA